MNYDIQCYIMRNGETVARNTKAVWPDMWLLKSEDVLSLGKPKNIVTESYAEADGLKVWTPTSAKHEATDVKLTFCFIGENRYRQHDSFVSYIDGKVFIWWDSVRLHASRLLLVEKTKPRESFYGNVPYIETEITFKNIDGKSVEYHHWTYEWSEPVSETGTLYMRNKVVTFTRASGSTTKTYNFSAAFTYDGTSYALISDATLSAMSSENYAARLNAFNGYCMANMASTYEDFSGVSGIFSGARTLPA